MIDFQGELTKYRSAADEAYRSMGGVIGLPLVKRADQLQAVRNMTVEDLDVLSEEYGADQVIHFLNKLSGGRHA